MQLSQPKTHEIKQGRLQIKSMLGFGVLAAPVSGYLKSVLSHKNAKSDVAIKKGDRPTSSSLKIEFIQELDKKRSRKICKDCDGRVEISTR